MRSKRNGAIVRTCFAESERTLLGGAEADAAHLARKAAQGAVGAVAKHFVEIGDRLAQALVEADLRLPLQLLAREGDVGAALDRIVLRQRAVDDLGARARELDDLGRQFEDR